MNKETSQYLIPECNLPALTKQINYLIKKAAKLGATPIIFTVGQAIEVPLYLDRSGEVDRDRPWFEDVRGPIPAENIRGYANYYPVTVEGEAPKLNGWAFAATLQAVELEGGGREGILRTVGNVEVPAEFRKRTGDCDHCRVERLRNDVYIVRHVDTNEFKVVGSTCLKDFLGHENPMEAARIAECIAMIGELCGGAEDEGYFGMGGSLCSAFPVSAILMIAATVIRIDGYFSSKKAREMDEPWRATAETLRTYFTARKGSRDYEEMRERYQIVDADQELAEKAREWAAGLAEQENLNEYQYSISVYARSAGAELRDFGYVASIISAYQREIGAAQEARISFKNSEYVGKEGEKVRLTLTLVSTNTIKGEGYGYRQQETLKTIMTYAQMREDGTANKVTWFATGTPEDEMMETGKEYKVIATIKKHNVYNGGLQTLVNRVILDKGQKVAQPKPKGERTLGKDKNKKSLKLGDWVMVESATMPGVYGHLSAEEMAKNEGKYTLITFKAKIVGTLSKKTQSTLLCVSSREQASDGFSVDVRHAIYHTSVLTKTDPPQLDSAVEAA